MLFGDFARDGKPQAVASLGAGAGLVGAVEAVEDRCGRSDPTAMTVAGVVHAQHRLRSRRRVRRVDLQRDVRPGRSPPRTCRRCRAASSPARRRRRGVAGHAHVAAGCRAASEDAALERHGFELEQCRPPPGPVRSTGSCGASRCQRPRVRVRALARSQHVVAPAAACAAPRAQSSPPTASAAPPCCPRATGGWTGSPG